MIHPNLVIEALTKGADGVIVIGCYLEEYLSDLGPSMYKGCHYIDGNKKAEQRADAIRLMLDDFGIEQERFKLDWISASESQKFVNLMQDFVNTLKYS
jgi:F420-non-reducing hydrogenase iron-sulfur subunit